MKPVVVIGSGPSGVHFARTILDMGRPVLMIDVGTRRPPIPLPDSSLVRLKSELDDPVDFFLGREFEGITFPGAAGEYYGIPPGREYIFREPAQFSATSRGFEPLFSFAAGGLAEAWTGGVYPFNEEELSAFPFSFAEIEPAYAEVAGRIGVSGEIDDLARFMPPHEHIMPPLRLDRQSNRLLERYARVRARLHEKGCWIGRSRLATTSVDGHGRKACTYLGRCLWGCPVSALYTPSLTLDECIGRPGFQYMSGVYITHFEAARGGRVRAVVGRDARGAEVRIETETLALAAGALNSARIFMESIYRDSGEIISLSGLMDNQQVLVPFVNLDMIGTPYEADSYQYHQLGLGLETDRPEHYVHGQITTLKTTMAHPIIQNLPFDLRASTAAFRHLRSALGLVNVNFHDVRRTSNVATLEPRTGAECALVLEYSPAPDEKRNIDDAVRRVRWALRKLHCIAPAGMTHARPKGASVHYAGLLPMSDSGGTLTTTPEGRSRDFDNLILADGITFPFLPAKNITFTLMANAVRVARANFEA